MKEKGKMEKGTEKENYTVRETEHFIYMSIETYRNLLANP